MKSKRSNLRTTVDKDNGGMLPAGDQIVWFVQHAVQLEARLPCETEDLWRTLLEWETWKKKTTIKKKNYTKNILL